MINISRQTADISKCPGTDEYPNEPLNSGNKCDKHFTVSKCDNLLSKQV